MEELAYPEWYRALGRGCNDGIQKTLTQGYESHSIFGDVFPGLSSCWIDFISLRGLHQLCNRRHYDLQVFFASHLGKRSHHLCGHGVSSKKSCSINRTFNFGNDS